MPEAGFSILVAVEAVDIHDAVRRALEEAGYHVLGARDGDAAAGLAVEQQPAVVIATPDLPRVRGPELIEIAKRAREPRPVAGLFLVSPTDSRPVPLAPLVGALRLPVGASAICEAIDKLVKELERAAPSPEKVAEPWSELAWDEALGLAPPSEAPGPACASGTFAERSLARVLFDARASNVTAHLTVRAGEVEKSIHLLHGRPVNCESSLAVEALGEMLLTDKIVSSEDLTRARDHMAAHGGGQAEALVAVGALDRPTLVAAVARHVRERIVTLFSWDDAVWRLEEVEREAVRPLVTDLEPLWLVVEGVRRYTVPRALLDFFDENQNRHPVPAPLMDRETAALTALTGGARIVELMNGEMSLSEMQRASGLDELLFTQLLLSLLDCGLISMEDAPRARPVRTRRCAEELIGERLPLSAETAVPGDDEEDEPGLQREARGVRGGSGGIGEAQGGEAPRASDGPPDPKDEPGLQREARGAQQKGSTQGTMVSGRGGEERRTLATSQEERDSAPDRCSPLARGQAWESTGSHVPRHTDGRNETHSEALHPRQGAVEPEREAFPSFSTVDPTMRDDVLGLYTRLSESDPFELLGVPPDAQAAGVAKAFAEWAARIGPDRIADVGDDDFARLAREVWLRLEEAYTALSDDDGRARWRAEHERRAAGGEGRRTRWLDADRAFRDGQDHLAAGRHEAAAEAFEAASGFNRRDPVYRLYAAWSAWLAARGKGDRAEMAALEQQTHEALEAIPILEEGWVFLGEMALERDDKEGARAHLERALIFNPGSKAARDAKKRL